MQSLCCDMVLYIAHYSPRAITWQRYMGRVFELVVLGLLRDVSVEDISRLLQKPPFYSIASYTGLSGYRESDSEEDDIYAETNEDDDIFLVTQKNIGAKEQLSNSINQWRKLVQSSGLILSPWLVFNALQRSFSRSFSSQLVPPQGNPPRVQPGEVFRAFGMAFFNVWSAFAYVEAGRLFNGSDAISNNRLRWKSISEEIDYKKTSMYKQNIRVLLVAGEKHDKLSVTYLLSKHPLCELALRSFHAMVEAEQETQLIDDTGSQENLRSREWMKRYVLVDEAFSAFKGKITAQHIVDALESGFPEFERANQMFYEFIAKYNKTSELAPRFEEAIKRVYKRPPQPLDKPTE